MHPTTSYQIATLQAAEVRRRADRRDTSALPRRSRDRRGVVTGLWIPLRPVRRLLPAFRSA
ncbi:MAG: hypothetical protein KY457_06135 [Actinobacteria bacterium]|nr:hypothetical protein [Actinomycetota bacterium]